MYSSFLWKLQKTRTFAFVIVCPKAKRIKAFRCPVITRNTRVFAPKEQMVKPTRMIEWFGILTPCHYPKNWIVMNAKNTSETLMERLVLKWIFIPIIDVSLFQLIELSGHICKRRNCIHYNKTEHCRYCCTQLST